MMSPNTRENSKPYNQNSLEKTKIDFMLRPKRPTFNHCLCFKPSQGMEVLWKTSLQRSSTAQLCQSPTTHLGSRPSSTTRVWLTRSSPVCLCQSQKQIYPGIRASTGTRIIGYQVSQRVNASATSQKSVNILIIMRLGDHLFNTIFKFCCISHRKLLITTIGCCIYR